MISFKSPAKINLFLRVLAKRKDGYHDLASLFQAIDLHDTLTLSFSEADEFYCDDPSIPSDSSNLIHKAVNLFKNKTGLDFTLKIDLQKRIPAMGGLGGGSSNAATTLYALDKLLNTNIPYQVLSDWGGEIGSDVSFFFSEGTAYCTGRGEVIEPLQRLPQSLPLYLLKPPFGISTAQVFKTLVIGAGDLPPPREMLSAFYNNSPHFHNDLEPPARLIEPQLDRYKKALMEIGFTDVFMTGSGSTLCCLGSPSHSLQLPFHLFHPIQFIQRASDAWY